MINVTGYWPPLEGKIVWTWSEGGWEEFVNLLCNELAAQLASTQPAGQVVMKWCSDGDPLEYTWDQNQGESDAAFRARIVDDMRSLLTQYPATDDCP